MRALVAALAGVSLIVTSGCSTIRNELRYPGGAPGRLLDERTFDASQSKQLALLRAAIALAIAARIGEGSISPVDADAFARQLADASNEINFAAVDAGFPAFVDPSDASKGIKPTCALPKGHLRNDPSVAVQPTGGWIQRVIVLYPTAVPAAQSYNAIDESCAGYYVNFEANIARIESRIVRAMLTSLPADKAREFLERLTGGNLLSALVSLVTSFGDIAGAFHRGAGVYRAGLENVAASTPECDRTERLAKVFGDYRQDRDTVLAAAACLGLSDEILFDEQTISADQLPNQVSPAAFLALFRIIRTSCVGLPLANSADDDDYLKNLRKIRANNCEYARFNPKSRPDKITVKEEDGGDSQTVTSAGQQAPASTPTPTPTPTPNPAPALDADQPQPPPEVPAPPPG